MLILYKPCNVCHWKVPPDSVIKALGVAGDVVEVPDSLARLGHVTVSHLRDDLAPHNLVTVRLEHDVSTGDVHHQHGRS